jgi:HSP20 family molecular chaperone IbpA
MSLFPRSFYGGPDTSFTPLFRLLDDFDNYRTEVQSPNGNGGRKGHRGIGARTFNPKFDVRETEDTYELHGELPGVDRENISIEFTEPQTIVIRGHVERTYQVGKPPKGFLEGTKVAGFLPESGEEQRHKGHKGQKASVEDERSEQGKEQQQQQEGKEQQQQQGKEEQQQQGKEQQQQGKEQQEEQQKEKYWVSERAVGEFCRTFTFPTRVDPDGVTASLENGILHVTVPKLKKHESRRIPVK